MDVQLPILILPIFEGIVSLFDDLNDLRLILQLLLKQHPRFVVRRAYEIGGTQLHHESKDDRGST